MAQVYSPLFVLPRPHPGFTVCRQRGLGSWPRHHRQFQHVQQEPLLSADKERHVGPVWRQRRPGENGDYHPYADLSTGRGNSARVCRVLSKSGIGGYAEWAEYRNVKIAGLLDQGRLMMRCCVCTPRRPTVLYHTQDTISGKRIHPGSSLAKRCAKIATHQYGAGKKPVSLSEKAHPPSGNGFLDGSRG